MYEKKNDSFVENISKIIINKYKGDIIPLYFIDERINGTGLCNPSIFVDNKIRVNLRHVEYSLFHSENSNFYSEQQGYLSYYHRDDKNELRTNNYYCELNPITLEIERYNLINTSAFDKKPMWCFIGLEDCRLVYWDNKYYLTGVRRDTTTNGVGRMELSEIEINENDVKEISRIRIELKNESYCEKNWMPILNKPYHFVKWTNPTEVVKVNLETNIAETIYLGNHISNLPRDIRGGTQLLKWNDECFLCITHETDFVQSDVNGWKNVDYYHRFIIFNNDFSIKFISNYFNFMSCRVEFCVGLAQHENDILITFGFQDNGSYLLKISKDNLIKLLENELS